MAAKKATVAAPARISGFVKWYNPTKAYDGERDVFVHVTALGDVQVGGPPIVLQPDDRVEFDIEQTEKGPQAANVVRIA